jgi:hypothetical protein
VVVLLALTGCASDPATPRADPPREVGADCGAGPVPATEENSPDAEAARDRVEAFIEDYHRAWERAGKPDSSFAAWDAELDRLAATHLVDEGGFALDEGGLSLPANHDPGHEAVESVAMEDGAAVVRTHTDVNAGSYYTYRVVRVRDEWRIAHTTLTFDPPTAPLMASAAHAELLGRVATSTSLQGSPREARQDLATLFAPPFTVTELTPITTSGVMAVHDFGWLGYDLAPLAQRVPAGRYAVEVAHRRDGTNVALRVQLSDDPTTRWVEADRVGSGNVVPVDAGNVVVLDFSTAPTCRNEWLEQLYADHLTATDGDVFSIAGGPADAVMVQSGYGDGGYPAYWGVADDGTITQLVVDFLVDRPDLRDADAHRDHSPENASDASFGSRHDR